MRVWSEVWCGDKGALRGSSYREIRGTATSVSWGKEAQKGIQKRSEKPEGQPSAGVPNAPERPGKRRAWERGPGLLMSSVRQLQWRGFSRMANCGDVRGDW